MTIMALNIRAPEAHRLAKRLAEQTGETITEVVVTALQERLERIDKARSAERGAMIEDVLAMASAFRRLPVVDPRSPDEILGYDENGLPG
jgi:antitoxin VapB